MQKLLSPGSVINRRFVLQHVLGAGGMGTVYRAVDSTTREPVALKLLHREMTGRQAMDLAHEGRALARLHHPNIARLVAYGSTDSIEGEPDAAASRRVLGRAWLASELCPGRPLTDWLDRLGLADFIHIVDEVLSGLAYVHARGIVHRDLKPDNVLVLEDQDGTLQASLVDFGVARVSEEEQLDAKTVLGTPSFMAPEMCVAEHYKVGRQTDLYAVGIMIHQFVTGRLPFRRENLLQTLDAHLNDPIPPLTARRGIRVPVELEPVVHRLLAKRPRDRYRFAAMVKRALAAMDFENVSVPIDPAAIHNVTSTGPTAAASPDTDQPELPHTPAEGVMTQQPTGIERLADSVESLKSGLLDPQQIEIIGRRAEREQAWKHLTTMLERGSLRTLLISGPAGVGKSRLAQWLKEKAEEEGLAEPLLNGVGANAALPGGGLDQLVERFLRAQWLPREKVREIIEEELLEPNTIRLGDAVQLLEFLRPEGGVLGSDQTAHPVGLCVQVLKAGAARGPMLLWLDDVSGPEAGEVAELMELLVLSRKLMKLPILVVATLRTAGDDEPAYRKLMELESLDPRSVVHLEMQPMPEEELNALVGALLPLDEEARKLAAEQSRGIPREAVEAVRSWLDQDSLVPTQAGRYTLSSRTPRVSSSARALDRLARLLIASERGQGLRAMAEAGAVLGQRIEYPLLVAVIEKTAESWLDLVPQLWNEMVEAGIWRGPEPEVAVWADAEIRERALSTLMSPARVIRLHGIVARVLEVELGDALGRHHFMLAEHYAAAGEYGDACRHLRLAADRLLHQGRLDDAEVAFQAIQDVLAEQSLTDALAWNDEADLGRAAVELERGAYDEVLGLVSRVESRARPHTRVLAVGRAAWTRAEVARRKGALDDAEALYLSARDQLENAGSPWHLARTLEGYAQFLAQVARYEDALDVIHDARHRYEVMKERFGVGRCVLHEARIEGMRLNYGESALLSREAIRTFEEIGARQQAALARIGLCDALYHLNRAEEAGALVELAVRDALAVGDQELITRCQWAAGTTRAALGDLEGARNELEVGLEIAAAMNNLLMVARLRNALGEVARTEGKWAEARLQYEAFGATAEAAGDPLSAAMARANVALVLLEEERWAEAIEELREAEAGMADLGHHNFERVFGLVRARAHAELGEWTAVETALERVKDVPRQTLHGMEEAVVALELIGALAGEVRPEMAASAQELLRKVI